MYYTGNYFSTGFKGQIVSAAMINYFNFKRFGKDYLITNDLGNYMFIEPEVFRKLVMDKIDVSCGRYDEFIEKGFVYSGSSEVFIDKFRHKMADSKSYLFDPTSLHIFVVTNVCNMHCVYCQAQSNMQKSRGNMSPETAQKAVDIALSSNAGHLTFEFQGGEPLINYDVIKFIIEYSEEKCRSKTIEYNLVSNLTLLTDEMLEFFKEHHVMISTSVDGDKAVHNKNRPYSGGRGTYDDVTAKLKAVQAAGLSSGAIQTTTRHSLGSYKEMIGTYISLGLKNIFIRPLTPLGFAHDSWSEIGYTDEEFLRFYRKCIDHLLELNKSGVYCSEGHAAIFLSKILSQHPVNYMELRSPCGAGIGQLAYYYDGKIFTCDEGRMFYEMGADAFQLGTVDDDYNSLIDSPVCRAAAAASTLEAIPGCCDCAYEPYCGTCPVLNLAFENNIFPTAPHDYKCGIYGGMMDILFDKIKRNDPEEMQILSSWIG